MHPQFFPFLVVFFINLCSLMLQAQNSFVQTNAVPVMANHVALKHPWAGGMNSCQFSTIDLDQDGVKDLFVFDRTGNKTQTFINNNIAGTVSYTYAPEYESLFPDLSYWVLLRDYNCDGKMDLFTYASGGIAVYKNVSDITNGLSFQLTEDLLNSFQDPNVTNLFVSPADLPHIGDLDNDGDLDILTFGLIGSYMEYHRNYSVENGHGCDTLEFQLRNKCWGYFSESLANNAVMLDDTCSWNVNHPELRSQITGTMAREVRHAGSSVLALDLDGDGDKDLLLGDISFNNLTMLENGGNTVNAYMVSQNNQFPSNTLSVDVEIFPGSFYEDVDNDGKRDLLVSPNTPNLSVNAQSVWFYKNNGTDGTPVFNHISNRFMQSDMIEVGEGAYPVFFDYNNDGLEDLFIGNTGYFQQIGVYTSQIALYENMGTSENPSFSLVTDDFENLSQIGLQEDVYPAFGDLDGDTDKDLLIGDRSGRLYYFENVAPIGSDADFTLAVTHFSDHTGATIDVGQNATPQLIDMNDDQLLDLVIGEKRGKINYYENIGTASVPSFRLMHDTFGHLNVKEYWAVDGYSVPHFYRDSTDALQLLVGSKTGYLHHFDSISNNLSGAFHLVDSTFKGIYTGIRSAPARTDLNGDGQGDLVIGNFRGGLGLFMGSDAVQVGLEEPKSNLQLHLYPNPAKDKVTFACEGHSGTELTLIVLDVIGRKMATHSIQGSCSFTLHVSDLPAGTYFCMATDGIGKSSRILLIHR